MSALQSVDAGAPVCCCDLGNGRQLRYGVFLRPSAELTEQALQANQITAGLFGFQSANAYPPHITLVGSISPSVPLAELLPVLDRVLANRPAVELTTVGMEAGPGSLGYRFTDARPGQAPVADLMGAILDAVAPLRHFHDDDFTAERRRNDSPANFAPHLSIISFDGPQRPGLVAETAELLAELGIGGPATAVFDRVHLLAFSSLDRTGPYWQTMQWELLHSWRLEHP